MIISAAYVVSMWLGYEIPFQVISSFNPAIALSEMAMITFHG
jgi:hypothetical protein